MVKINDSMNTTKLFTSSPNTIRLLRHACTAPIHINRITPVNNYDHLIANIVT